MICLNNKNSIKLFGPEYVTTPIKFGIKRDISTAIRLNDLPANRRFQSRKMSADQFFQNSSKTELSTQKVNYFLYSLDFSCTYKLLKHSY